MKKKRIAQPSTRTLLTVGTAALLLALAGTGGAVAGAVVTGKQIKDGSVTTADIKDKTLKTTDLAPATVTALTGKVGPAGTAGPAGPAGPAGATGPAGAPGVAGANGLTDIAVRPTFFEPNATGGTFEAFCHADERAVTATFKTDGDQGGIPVLTESFPVRADGEAVLDTIPQGSGWHAKLINAGATGMVTGSMSVVCTKDAS